MTNEYSPEVWYHPWVGDRYREQQQRWLILGESSYGLDLTDTHAANEMVRAHCGEVIGSFEGGTYRICAAAERLMTARNTFDRPSKEHFWQTVAFYNYVRDSMPNSETRPTTLQYRQSLAGFNEVVCKLRPHVVLVLGIELWKALPGEREGWNKGQEHEIVMPVYSRKFSLWTGSADCPPERHTFMCFPVAHPSSRGFAVANWIEWMRTAKAAVAAQDKQI